MKFCNKCGENLIPGTKFCKKCGNKIDLSAVEFENSKTFTNEEKSFEPIEDSKPIEYSKPTENPRPVDDYKPTENFKEKDNKPTPKKKKIKKILFIVVPITLVIIAIGSFLYFKKDTLLYNYYYNKASKQNSTNAKLEDYNKALKYSYSDEIIEDIYNLFKDDSYFESEINSIPNLNNDDKSKLITKICLYKADNYFNSKDYTSALNSLELASKYGYDITTYPNYEAIKNSLDESNDVPDNLDPKYSFKNNNPSADPKDIYKYSDDYVIYDSNYRYLTKSELNEYNKEALALIRNEIFARYGYVFQTEPFKSYFNSKDWYHPNPSFKGEESELNEYERANINLILEMEKNR